MSLMEEYRAYRSAWRFYDQGSKGIERIMKLPERQRGAIVDMLIGMRQAQGLPFDEQMIFADMAANDPDEEEDDDW